MSHPATEAQIVEALRKLHPSPEWAFLPGCGNGTGGNRDREADALAMSLWPSRGIELHGFEVKSHRGDWLRERKDPEKAEAFAQRCHRWSLVVADEKIAPLAEVPPAWGLLVMDGRKLRVVRPATLREPKELTWPFLAALLRTSAKGTEALLSQMVPKSEVDEEIEAGAKLLAASETKRLQQELDAIRNVIANFEAVIGMKLQEWRFGYEAARVAAALKLIMDAGGPLRVADHVRGNIASARTNARMAIEALARLEQQCAEIEAQAAQTEAA